MEKLEIKRKITISPKIKKKQKLEKEEQQELWSKLHIDLCRQIIGKLRHIDQVRFCAVCKNWMEVDEYHRIPLSLPWVITIDTRQRLNNKLIYQLYETSSNLTKLSNAENLDFREFGVTPCNLWCLQSDITCKYGWLFFSIVNQYFPCTRFLLFCPLTQEFIKLPQILDLPNTEFVKGLSTQPKSPDCMFLVLNDNDSENSITINTYKYGEKDWTSRTFDKLRYTCRACSFVYIHGIFYIAFPGGYLVSYDIAQGALTVANYGSYCNNTANFEINEVFELDGQLFLIIVRRNGSGIIQKFDRSNKVWLPLKSLGDQAMFVSSHSSWVSTVGDEARKYGVLPNNIYYLNKGRCKIYTLENNDDYLVERTDASAIAYTSRFDNLDRDLTFWLKHPSQLMKEKNTIYV